jgi:tetratricopeptide (TPR) repeat protein
MAVAPGELGWHEKIGVGHRSPISMLVAARLPLLIVTIVFISFYPLGANDFVNWDDPFFFTGNPHYRGLSPVQLRWIFTTLYMGTYQPLTWLTHAVVYTVWGMNPVAYHVGSLVLHAANAVVLFFLIRTLLPMNLRPTWRMNSRQRNAPSRPAATPPAPAVGPGAHAGGLGASCCRGFQPPRGGQPVRGRSEAGSSSVRSLGAAWSDATLPDDGALYVAASVGALFFAIHPLRVEAVAWATDRGQVLCTFFFLLSVLAYVRMQTGKVLGGAWFGWYVTSIAWFTLSLAAAGSGITMPLVLLVLDVYPLRRLPRGEEMAAGRQLIIEKIPYVVVAAGAALLVLLARQPEAMATLAEHGLAARTMEVFYGLWFYVWKTLVPMNLSPLYLLEKPLHPAAPRFVLSALLVIAMTGGLIFWRRRWPALLAAWAAYVLILLPVSGIAQSGPQITADRYTYLACLPWAVLFAAGVYRCVPASRWSPGRWQWAAAITVGLLLLFLGVRTSQQTRVWKDSIALWSHVLAIEPHNFLAYNNRGEARYSAGDVDGALLDFTRSIELNPSYDNAYGNRGTARLAKGDARGALKDYDRALRINPRYTSAYYNRGNLRKTNGDLDGALADYQRALALAPDYAVAYNARGRTYQAKDDLEAALADYNRAIQLDPGYANAYNNRSTVRSAQGDLAGAIADCTEAVRLSPAKAPHRDVFERNLAQLRRQLAGRDGNR